MNIFVVESPTQALNALEARQRFDLKASTIYVLMTGLFARAMYERVLDPLHWSAVVYVDFRFVARKYDFGTTPPRNLAERLIELSTVADLFRKRAIVDRLARRCGRVERLFLGQYRTDTRLYFRHFANVCRHDELLLLDDGTDTVLINAQRSEEAAGRVVADDVGSGQGLKSAIKNRFGRWNAAGAPSLTFFSALKFSVNARDKLIHNDYRYLRSLANGSASRQNTVFFLGATLVDDSYLTLQTHLDLLRRILRRFEGREFIYVAHPRESQRYLDVIATELDVNVQRFPVPIEFEMTVNGNRPGILASFFSSALENCARLFGSGMQIQAFRLTTDHLVTHQDEVLNIYIHLEKAEHIQVLDP
jgi:hypothetical protein